VETKKLFYLAGLPRTGSTVLGEILNQNENIHVSPASPLSEIVSEVLAKWRMNTVTLKAYKHPDLHKLGPKLRDRSWKAKDVLGNRLFFKYKRLDFWRPKKRNF
jgi:hypothetical protein